MKTKRPLRKLTQTVIDKQHIELFNTLSNFVGINYTVMDVNGNFIFKNDYFTDRFPNIRKASELTDAWNDCIKVMQSKKRVMVQEEYENKYYISIKQPLLQGDNCEGIMVLSFDITDKKQTELALIEQTKKTKLAYQQNSDFLSLASHEIRGPVGNVISILEIIKRFFVSQGLDKTEKKYAGLLDGALLESRNALSSIDYLLKLLALFRDGIKPAVSMCNLRRYVENTINHHRQFDSKQIVFKSEVDESISEEVVFDFYHLREILDILLSNAIKYSYDNGIITMKVEQVQNSLQFTVKDNGIGISKPHLENLLLPFISIGDKNSAEDELMHFRKPSIKLNYVKTMLDYMFGNISVKSKQRKGTEIIVTVPFSEYRSKKNPDNAICDEQKPKSMNELKILLVEDNPMTLELQKAELEELAAQIDTTEEGYEAIRLSKIKDYDVVFLDITLNDITGVEVLEKMEARYEDKTKAPYFVAVTSRASEDEVDYFTSNGFTAVLTKPATKKDFYECIKTLLKIRLLED